MRTFTTILLGTFLLLLTARAEALRAAPATQPSTQAGTQPAKKAVSSKPVEKNGLQVTVNLPQAVFAKNEPVKFSVQFKNVSKKDFVLHNVNQYWEWQIRFEPVGVKSPANGPWQLSFNKMAAISTNQTVKPTEDFAVAVEPPQKFHEYVWKGNQRESVPPIKQLTPGKYKLTLAITLAEDRDPRNVREKSAAAFWAGTLTTEPVEFEISDKEPAQAAATQVAEVKGKTGTLTGKVVNKAGDAVEGALVFVYIRKPVRDQSMTKVAESKTNADGIFELTIDAQDELVVNVFQSKGDAWAKAGISVKANEKTDLGEIKLAPLTM